MSFTTITIGAPHVGDEGRLIDGVDFSTREMLMITGLGTDPDGTPTMDIDVWDEATQSYTSHTGIRWESSG